MDIGTIRSKQQFKHLLAKELGYKPGPLLLPKNRFAQYHKPIKLSDRSTGFVTLIFENVGDPYLGEQELLINMGALLPIPDNEQYARSTFNHWWIGNLSENLLRKVADPKIFAAFNVLKDSDIDSQGISTIERFQRIKELILELEKQNFFKEQLEVLLQTYKLGLQVKNEVIKRLPALLPGFKHILDEYNERSKIVFYTDSIKGKILSPVIQIGYGHKDWITFAIGKGKIENGKLVANPKDTMYRYFYRNSPQYMYSHDNYPNSDQKQIGWKYEKLHEALKELKRFVESYNV